KRIVRNIFISLWEGRSDLPVNFSMSVYLYTEVRKAVVQCINVKLNKEIDIPVIESRIIPGFSILELQKAKEPVRRQSEYPSSFFKRRYEEPWWNKFSAANLKHAVQSMFNFW